MQANSASIEAVKSNNLSINKEDAYAFRKQCEYNMVGMANILFFAGALYAVYNMRDRGFSVIKDPTCWGVLLPSTLFLVAHISERTRE